MVSGGRGRICSWAPRGCGQLRVSYQTHVTSHGGATAAWVLMGTFPACTREPLSDC